jgi:citrate lyase subunit beta / citryl-CoA lyase
VTAPTRMRRSLHFVPGGNERMIAKALTLPADGLILDLEDAVTPDKKAATRPIVRRWLETLDFGGREKWIRMNPIGSEHAESDIAETIAGRPDGYVVPKPNRAEDVRRVVALIEQGEARNGLPFGSTRLLPIATETPEGLLNIKEIAAASPRIAAISWGVEDLGAAMGLPRVRDAEGRYLDIGRHARVMCAVAAAAAGVEAIDTVFVNFRDLAGLEADAEAGRRDGFSGKLAIHPDQVPIINRAFTPSAEVVARARRIVDAFVAAGGAGVATLDGEMIDRPHLGRAELVLARAKAAGDK